jgi:hypothetical protein
MTYEHNMITLSLLGTSAEPSRVLLLLQRPLFQNTTPRVLVPDLVQTPFHARAPPAHWLPPLP